MSTAKTNDLAAITLVCLVSNQPMPNLLSIIQLRPRRVVLVSTSQMEEKAGQLKDVTLQHLPHCEVKIVPLASAYDYDVITETMYKNLVQILPDAGEIILNATGGTKLMVLASVDLFDKKQILYVSEATDELIYLPRTSASGSRPPQAVRTPITVLTYLKVHGYTTERSRSTPLPLSQHFFEQITNQQKFASALSAVNALAKKALENSKARKALSAEIENAANSNLLQLLEIFQDEHLLSVKKNVVEFPSEEARFAVNGGWFEDHVYEIVKSLKSHGIKYVEKNLKIAPNGKQIGQGSDNEIDVCFMHRSTIYFVECKTCAMEDTKATTPIFDKLNTIAQSKHMGNKTCQILVSYQRIASAAARARAEANGIHLIDGNNIRQLRKNLLAILDKEPTHP